MCLATWSDEDFIGRIARCAGKVHPMQRVRNTKRCLTTGMGSKEWLKVPDSESPNGEKQCVRRVLDQGWLTEVDRS